MRMFVPAALTLALFLAPVAAVAAVAASLRDVPAKSVTVPNVDVSPQMQALIGAPLRAGWDTRWKTAQEARAAADLAAVARTPVISGMLARLHVTATPSFIGGVRVYIVTPATIPAANRGKLLIHVHGGCYVLNPGLAGAAEAIIMAGIGHYKVISVDYRMPPEGYFPAALDDAITVYRAALKDTPARNIAVFGTSAGGALTLEMMLKARQLGLPMPAAIAPGSPMADVSGPGDTFQTNAKVDNVLVSPDGFCDADTRLYAHGHDLKDPLLSPIYGDMHGFPPAILTSGTRDLLLSNTVRVHRKLRRSGVEAILQVFEGQSHAQFQADDRAPETHEAFGEIAGFFAAHLGR